ncbi:universal stress protein [uncultured Serinicoccus sp.]|uniref:universal stress protein n=1 Tax=uncultured Serinicoccus sp. TaxID=735514 RepID=UPI002620D672|nr:universal stress protein [uncultured Serinicoccus sp.]
MSGRVVVGYTATPEGRDALVWAARLSAAAGEELHVAMILPSDERSVITPPDAGYDRHLRERAQGWLDEATSALPTGTAHRTHVRYADSFAEGLIDLADDLDASTIVVGAADGAHLGRHRLGSTTNELLHSSDVPVMVVPRGSAETEGSDGIPRLTVAVGTRPGAPALLHEAVRLATATGAGLRLVSLVTVDLPGSIDTQTIRMAGEAHAGEVMKAVRSALPEGLHVETVTGRGSTIQEAVSQLDWRPGEVILVGSSRLASHRRLFLGSTASKMLRELTVPMVVVPRTGATHHEGVVS